MGVVVGTGNYVLFMWRTILSLRFSPPHIEDILESTLTALRLSWRPVVAISIPFGMAVAFNFDSLLAVIGARQFAGGSIGPSAVVIESPLLAALVVAAVAGAAFCADLGARKIREELASMETMGVNPLPRLVIPRVLGTTFTVPVMYFLGGASFFIGAYVLLVVFRGTNPGVFLDAVERLISVRDVMISVVKTTAYGFIVGVTACYFGFHAEGGPAGVASKVRMSIITNLVLIFVAEYAVISLFYGGFG